MLRQLSYPLVLMPALFLLVWSGVQLRTMTWAYNPALPVRTLPPRAALSQPVNEPLNEFVTLLGFERSFDEVNRVLQLELEWLSTGISPVDYLTDRCILPSDYSGICNQSPEPVKHINYFFTGNPGEQILISTGKANNFMRKCGTDYQQDIIFKDLFIDRYMYILIQ